MELTTLVQKSADAILEMEHANQLMGGGLWVAGAERVMLVSAIRSRVDVNLDDCQAYALADFLPLAFIRVAMSNSDVRFHTHFGRKDSRGRIRQYRSLSEEPVFRESSALAQQWSQVRPQDVVTIGKLSCEQAVVQQSLASGSNAADLELAPPLLNGPDEACPPVAESPKFSEQPWWLSHWKAKPWWKFW